MESNKKFYSVDKFRVSVVFNLILIINVIVLAFMYMNKENELIEVSTNLTNQINALTAELDTVNATHAEEIAKREADMQSFKESYEELYSLALEVNKHNEELLDDNIQLEADNIKLLEENEDLADRVNVYETYKVFMFRDDYSGRRTDCSYELLTYLQSLIEDKAVNNLAFYCSWIMIESTWCNHDYNARSTAYGLPQFLSSTGKWIYEEELGYGKGTYNHEMVTDPYISLPMMVKYIDILCHSYSGDLHKTIDSYRGLHDVPYLNKFNRYLAMFDTSIDQLAVEVEANYLKMQEPQG